MDWHPEAEAAAQLAYPREACGLLVVIKGRERLILCENHAKGDDHFIISAEDYAEAEDKGEIVGVWHSHCNIGPQPSEADLVACESSNLPWHIYATPANRWHEFKPTGYRAPLIGRSFQPPTLDCYSLIRDFYSETYGITLMDFDREDNWWQRGQNLYLDNFEKAGFKQVDRPQHGDVLLMNIGAKVPNHGAIWLEGDMILHHLHSRLSSRDVYGEYYRRCTVKILRYAPTN